MMLVRVSLLLVAGIFVMGCGDKSLPEANVDAGNADSKLTEAIMNGETATVQQILESDPDLASSVDAMGQTPLHYAAAADNPKIVELLLEQGADPQRMNDEGQTPEEAAQQTGASGEVLALLAGDG